MYIFIKEPFFDKFLSKTDKTWQDQLKIITANRGNSFSELSHRYKDERGIPKRKEKHPVLRTNTELEQLIKRPKISYPIASLVFHKFLCGTYRDGLNRGTFKLRHFKYLKTMNRGSLIPFVLNSHFNILVHRVRYLKNLFVPRRQQAIIFLSEFKIRN